MNPLSVARRSSIALLLLIGLGASSALRAETDPTERFHSLLTDYYEDYVALYPVEAALNGDADSRYEHVWPNDLTPEFRTKVAAMCDWFLGELSKFDRASLPEADRLSYDILTWELALRRESTRQFTYLTPVNQFYSPAITFAQMASGAYVHPFKTSADYRNFISRAQGFGGWVDTAIVNMREGVARGIVQPRVIIEKVLVQLAPLMADDPEKNVLFGPLKHLPSDLDADTRVKLSIEYGDGVREYMLPAYHRLYVFLKDEYLPKCRATAGLGALLGGADAYAFAIRAQTTTGLTADQIHELGLKEVAGIRGEIEAVRKRVGFKGTVPEFLRFVTTDPKFTPFKTDEDVLGAYRAIERRVMARIPEFFGRVPRTKFEIRATEKFRAASASSEYVPGSPDGTRPGIFYVPILDPQKVRTLRMEDLFLHEAIPGHHFQISLAAENAALPRFRRFDVNNAFVEGWALYCESLGSELGLYTDPYEYLGMLLANQHRAVRLVVDTGLHAKGWTREQAAAYVAEQVGGTSQQYLAEIERYMAMPGQALGYKIGQFKIRELRATAEKSLGPKFKLSAFHHELLAQGAMPLDVLDAHMREWIAARARQPQL